MSQVEFAELLGISDNTYVILSMAGEQLAQKQRQHWLKN